MGNEGMKKLALEFLNKHSLVRVTKTNGFYSIGYISEITDDGIILLNDKTNLKFFISWGLVLEMSVQEEWKR